MKTLLACLCLGLCGLAARADTAPELTLRINGHFPTRKFFELSVGEPVIAEVTLLHPDRSATSPLTLDPPTGNWSDRVTIRVTDAKGAVLPWRFSVTGKPGTGALALQPNARTRVVLRMELSDSAALLPGEYRVTALLNLADGRAWQGTAKSLYCPVRVVVPPSQPTDEQLGQRQLLRVRDALLTGDTAKAETTAKEMLRATLKRPEGFAALALVQEAKGQLKFAEISVNIAINLHLELSTPATPTPTSAALPATADKTTTPPTTAKPTAKAPKPPKPKLELIRTPYDDLRARIESELGDAPETAAPAAAPDQTKSKSKT